MSDSLQYCDCSTPDLPTFIISQSLLKLTSIESKMPSNHLILFRPLLLLSIFPSIRVFSSELALHIMWPKDWNFSISPSNEYSGLFSQFIQTLSSTFQKEICVLISNTVYQEISLNQHLRSACLHPVLGIPSWSSG